MRGQPNCQPSQSYHQERSVGCHGAWVAGVTHADQYEADAGQHGHGRVPHRLAEHECPETMHACNHAADIPRARVQRHARDELQGQRPHPVCWCRPISDEVQTPMHSCRRPCEQKRGDADWPYGLHMLRLSKPSRGKGVTPRPTLDRVGACAGGLVTPQGVTPREAKPKASNTSADLCDHHTLLESIAPRMPRGAAGAAARPLLLCMLLEEDLPLDAGSGLGSVVAAGRGGQGGFCGSPLGSPQPKQNRRLTELLTHAFCCPRSDW